MRSIRTKGKRQDRGGAGGVFTFVLPRRPLAPHSLLFLVYNIGYLLPVLAIFLVGFSGPGGKAGLKAGLDYGVLVKILYIYFGGVFAFVAGSKLSPFLTTLTARPRIRDRLTPFELNGGFWAFCWFSVAVFIATKLLLIPRGVYSGYAFDTGKMTGGLWSFSMFWSDVLLFLSVVVLFSSSRHNLRDFLLLNVINGINLLHGTRIIFVIAGITLCFYLFVRGKLGFKRLVVFAVCLLAACYVVFLFRSHVALNENALGFSRIISPVMDESIFSQVSLMVLVQQPHLWGHQIFPLNFFSDIFAFTIPRFLLPGKGQLTSMAQFQYLAVGAFSGYAQGLIYFGLLYPLFYFTLGVGADWLLRRARYSAFWSVLYVSFVCEFLFRIMREYPGPSKVLADNLVILLFLVFLLSPQPSRSLTSLSNRPVGTSLPPGEGAVGSVNP